MSNSYYTFSPRFIPGTKVRAQAVNTQFDLLEDAFDLLPTLPGSIALGTSTLGVESGSGNAYVVTMPKTRTANADGDEVVFKATHQNSGASTLQVDAIPAVPWVRFNGDALSSGDVLVGSYYAARYDATNIRFITTSPAQNTVVGTISYATPSGKAKLAASAGAATTLIRSDADIAIDQTIAPTWSGQHTFEAAALFASGTAALPGIAFENDADTGFYRIGANRIGIALNGTNYLDMSVSGINISNAPIFVVADGSVSSPVFQFNSDTNTGIYRLGADYFGFTVGGNLAFAARFIATTAQFMAVDGSAAVPAIAFDADVDTGFYRIGANNFGAATNGTLRFDISTTAITSTLPHLNADGSAIAPAFSFSSDTNTGSYSVSADTWGVATGGVLRFSVNSSGNGVFTGAVSGTNLSASGGANPSASIGLAAVNGSAITFMRSDGAPALSQSISPTWSGTHTFSLATLFADGLVSAPAVAFTLDSNTGFYRVAADSFAAAVNGTFVAGWRDSGGAVVQTVFNDGTAGVPAISFNNDSDTGMYRTTTNTIAFAAGGTRTATIDSSQLLLIDGTVSLPAFSFLNDSDTGIFRSGANDARLVAGGVATAIWTTAAFYTRLPIYAQDGAVGAPGYSFENDTDTGFYRIGANRMGFVLNATTYLDMSVSGINISNAPLFAVGDGNVGSPVFQFNSDGNTGIYRLGSDYFGFAAGGTLAFAARFIATTAQFMAVDGSAAVPAVAFDADVDTGFYRIGANNFGAATNGTLRFDISTTAITSTLPHLNADGSVTAPAFSFSGDTNTGMFRNAADDVRITAGGVSGVIVTGNGSLANVELGSSSSSALTLNCISSASASAGGTAIPTAAGFLTVIINGTTRKIPYCAN